MCICLSFKPLEHPKSDGISDGNVLVDSIFYKFLKKNTKTLLTLGELRFWRNTQLTLALR